MLLGSDRLTLETVTEESDTRYGFTWVSVDGKCLLRTPDDQFKEVPEVVVETLKDNATELTVEELIEETAEMDSDAADRLREMHREGFIREGAPVERVRSPEDVRLWPWLVVGVLLVVVACVLLVLTLLSLSGRFLEDPFGYLLKSVFVAVPMVAGSVAIHEFGHYRTAWKQGLDPSVGFSVINGVLPAVVTRTHGGWMLPLKRRMLNTLAGPAYGVAWTIGVFALYHTVAPYPEVGIAGVVCFQFQVSSLLPIFHGDGYTLLTDYLDDPNLKTRGKDDLRNLRPTWAAGYALFTYGYVISQTVLDLVIGYIVGDYLGVLVVLGIAAAIYAESRLGVVRRLLRAASPSGG